MTKEREVISVHLRKRMGNGDDILCIGNTTDEYNNAVWQFERACAGVEQVTIQTKHLLHGGMYARHATIPANTVLTGALTSCDNVCVVNGDITVTTDDGTRRITGFAVLPARAGYKRMGIAHAETEWVMVMATDAKTVADAEYAMTSEPESLLTRKAAICDHSNSDYETFVAELGWSSEVINDVVQNHLDLMVTARCFEMAEIRPSKIHGVGMFAKMHIGAGINIAPARIGEMRCACGRWMNHSKNPNCMFVLRDGMDGADVIAMRDIAKDEELTVNYRHAAAIAVYINKEMR